MSRLFSNSSKNYVVKKGCIAGEVIVPPSKSHTLRAILFAMLGDGKSMIYNPLISPDSLAMIQACRLFGANIQMLSDRVEVNGIHGKVLQTEDVINAGNSGIVLRFCSAVGALAKHPIVVTGDASIRHKRPMKPLIEALKQLGVTVQSMRGDDFAPVIIQGPLHSGKAVIDGEDSQHVSAMLIASAFSPGPIALEVRNPGEKPWVALTLDWFDRLGIPYAQHQFEKYSLPGGARCAAFEYDVPGDFSSAAFPIAAALITNSEVILKNVNMHDSQGDKELIAVFQRMGGNIEIDEKNKEICVKKESHLVGVEVDINNFIDAITILAVVACFAEGETVIYHAGIARHKECNRIASIVSELKKMEAQIEETEDGLIIQGAPLKGAIVNSHADHRMAMSLVVAGLAANRETTILDVECISKTFPTFLQDFRSVGADIAETRLV